MFTEQTLGIVTNTTAIFSTADNTIPSMQCSHVADHRTSDWSTGVLNTRTQYESSESA